MSNPEPNIEEIVAEIQDDFDIDDLLNGRSHVDSTIRLYTDEKTGQELGGSEVDRNQFGLGMKRRWGVLGELDEKKEIIERAEKAIKVMEDGDAKALLEAEVEAENAKVVALGKRAGELLDRLNRTAIDLEIQSLHPVIIKDCRRRAKAALQIKGKVSEDQSEEYMDQFNVEVLVACVSKYTIVGNGNTRDRITVDQAKNLYEKLPPSEVVKLDAKIDEIVFRSAIAQQVSLDSDF